MTLTPQDLIKRKIEVGDNVFELDNDIIKYYVQASKVADELDKIMSATAEIDWSKEQYAYMNSCLRELRDTLRGESQEGKR